MARTRQQRKGRPIRPLTIIAASFLLLAPVARSGTTSPPASFVADALCVHSGWHWTSHWVKHQRPGYVLFGHGFWRTWDVPDNISGGSGEGGWQTVNSYGGGLQFTLGTWNNAASWSAGTVPYASSNSAIAEQPPRIQILAAWFVVRRRGSWADWPNTSRACGLR